MLRTGALSLDDLNAVLEPLGRRPSRTRDSHCMREYLLVFLVAASVTYLLTVIAREIALRTGAVAQVRDRDVHAVPIPYFGGLAMLGGLVAAYLVARELPFLSLSGPNVFRDARVVLIAGALICAVGVLDDLFELDALTKLGGQVLAAGFLIAFGVQYRLLPRARRRPVLARPVPGGAAHRADRGRRRSTRSTSSTASTASRPAWSAIGAVAFFLFCYQLANLNGSVAGDHRRRCCARRSPAPARASSRTTSTRPGCSWATAARCCSAWCCRPPRSR